MGAKNILYRVPNKDFVTVMVHTDAISQGAGLLTRLARLEISTISIV
jgi:hypothetical protein